MIAPKKYTATVALSEPPDVFTGKRRVVTGYYVKHVDITVNPLQESKEAWEKVHEEHTHHYIFCTGFSDWNLPTDLEQWEIDPSTLEEAKP